MSTLSDDTVCTPEQLADAATSGFYCLTRSQNIGLTLVTTTGFVSLFTVCVIFALIVRNVVQVRRLRRPPALIKTPMDLFMLSLFTADLLQSFGVLLSAKWIADGIVHTGGVCTAQGLFMNIGEAAIATTTLIITVYTFDMVWRSNTSGKRSLGTAYTLVCVQWIFLVLLAVISASTKETYYTPTPYWCWVNDAYQNNRFVSENFWLWLAFGASVMYIPLILWSRGYVTPTRWGFKIHKQKPIGLNQDRQRISIYLIICALAYCIPVFPTSLARWFLVVHGDVKPFAPAPAQFSVKAIFGLSGLFDVVAFLLTRQGLLLFRRRDESQLSTTSSSLEMQVPPEQPNGLARRESEIYPFDLNLPADFKGPRLKNHRNGTSLTGCGLLLIWLGINALDVIWIVFYIQSATDPNPRTAVNISHSGWEAYYIMMYISGFLWGCINAIISCQYFQASVSWLTRSQKAFKIRVLWFLFHAFIAFPIAVLLTTGPFFSPLIALKITQKEAWYHRCDSFPVEVILNGRLYNSPWEQSPYASFYFRQPDGSLVKYYDFDLTMDMNTATVYHFQPVLASSANITSPAVQDIAYQFVNDTFTVQCTDGSSCGNGTFDESGFLSLTINSNSSTDHLRSVDTGWFYPQSDDAPSFILQEVNPDNTLGETIIRTAVTEEENCAALKVCSATMGSMDFRALVAIGLTLMKQNLYSMLCTVPNSN